MEYERIRGVLAVQQRANEVEVPEINQLLQQKSPCCLLQPPGPYSDDDTARSGDIAPPGCEIEELEVEVLEWTRRKKQVSVGAFASFCHDAQDPVGSYRRSLAHFADVDGLVDAGHVQREEDVPESVVQQLLEPLLPLGRAEADGAEARPPGRLRPGPFGPRLVSQVVRRPRAMQLPGLLERAQLVRAPNQGDIVRGAQLHGGKRQIPQREALEVTELAVLR